MRETALGNNTETRILVADDEKLLVDSYAALLSRHFDVETATSGAETLDALDESIDIVILDRRMPKYTGAELLAEIRERGLDCHVIICSGVEPEYDIIGMDFDDYLVKPIGNDDILGAVERQLYLDSYDETVREYCALEAKRRALEQSNSRITMTSNHEFERLEDRIESLEQSLEVSDIDPRQAV